MEATHWIELVTLLITVLGLLGVFKRLSNKIDRKVDEASELNMQLDKKFFAMVAEQMKTKADNTDPEKTRALDIEFEDGERYVALLILGGWIQLANGVKMQGLYERNNTTTYQIIIDNVWRLRSHRHTEKEYVEVLAGRMEDRTTGHVYQKGEIWEIPAGEYHTVDFEAEDEEPCIIKVTTVPALKPLHERPLLLDHMEGLNGVAG